MLILRSFLSYVKGQNEIQVNWFESSLVLNYLSCNIHNSLTSDHDNLINLLLLKSLCYVLS